MVVARRLVEQVEWDWPDRKLFAVDAAASAEGASMLLGAQPSAFMEQSAESVAGEVRFGPGAALRVAEYLDERASDEVDGVMPKAPVEELVGRGCSPGVLPASAVWGM